MKKLFFAALAMVAVLFASCEKIEPTAVNPEELGSSAKITGFVQYQYNTKSDTKVDILPRHAVTVLRGTLVDGKMSYQSHQVFTNNQGFYSIDLPAAAGKSIDEVKVLATYQTDTYYVNQEGKTVSGNALFTAERSESNVAAGLVTNINLMLVPVAYTDEPAK